MGRPHTPLLNSIRRGLAVGGAALVLLLSLFAASPVLHERLHHGTTGTFDDGCAVVLFASGVSVPLSVVAPPPPELARTAEPIGSAEVLLDSPRYLLLPGRGPPAG